jgi:CBS-domain-containing membrane protein
MLVKLSSGEEVSLDVDADMGMSDETLDKDMTSLPRIIAKYAELAAECNMNQLNAKNDMDRAEAGAAQRIRKNHADLGEKITEAGIRELMLHSEGVKTSRNEYYAAVSQHGLMENLYRALRDKSSLAIALCYKQKEEIRVMSSSLN